MDRFNVLIIGDIILDFYYIGKTLGYEQDSIAPKFIYDNRYLYLGGAGNVAANVAAANMNAYMCSIVNDKYKEIVNELFIQANVSPKFLLYESDFPISIKHRYYERESILFRVDEEKIQSSKINQQLVETLINSISESISFFDCIIIADYAKGVLNDNSIAQIIKRANRYNIPTIIDPAKRSIQKYSNSTIIKLNKKELQYFSNISIINNDDLFIGVQYLLEKTKCQIVIVTCSEKGIFYLSQKGKSHFIKNEIQETAHVIGSGDTVTAYTAYCLLHNLDEKRFLQILSIAGELSVKEFGTSHIMLNDILTKI